MVSLVVWSQWLYGLNGCIDSKSFSKPEMYLWWSLCPSILLACLASYLGGSGLCCCVCVTSFECKLTPFCVDSETLGFRMLVLCGAYTKTIESTNKGAN